MSSSEITLPALKTLFATVTAGLTGTLIYHYLKSKFFTIQDAEGKHKVEILHVEIPKETVAYLIGRDGNHVKSIEEETGTSISFIDPGGPCRMAVIRGPKDNAQVAKNKLLKSVEEFSQLETEEIFVSERTMARLTENDNSKLREISTSSKTRVYIYGVQEKPNSLLVRGTYHQIEQVRNRLKELASDEQLPEPSSQPPKSISPILSSPKLPEISTLPAQQVTIAQEVLESTSSDGYCEVMVSMVKNPLKFYVQKAGPVSKEVDRLLEDMTSYYSDVNNRKNHEIVTLESDLHVAVLDEDKCWYRAKIVSTEEQIPEVTVQLIDFGDTITVQPSDIASLKSDFMTLPSQAIECQLANVLPIDEWELKWDDGAIEAFEKMTYCTQWKILMARIESQNVVDGKSIPCVKLIDTNTEVDVDVALKLVELGHASFKPWLPD